jgi:hypothetical protein
LGGLPTLGYGPVLAQPSPVARDNDPGALFREIADGAEQIGKIFQPALNAKAAQMGSESVTRDEQGNLQIKPLRPVLTEADQAYENAAHLKYLSEATLDAQSRLAQLREQHLGDPQGFQAGVDGLIIGATKNAPPLFQQDLTAMILRQAGAIHQDMLNAKLQHDALTATASADALFEANKNKLLDYAFQNRMADPAAQALLAQNIDILRAQAANPVLHVDQQMAELKIKELQSAIAAQGIIGHATKIYTDNPELDPMGVIDKASKDLHDPDLGLSPAEINSAEARIRAAINETHAFTNQKRMELRQEVQFRVDDAMAAALTGGADARAKVLSNEEIMAAFPGPQGAQIIGKLDTNAAIYSMRKVVAFASPQRLAEMDRELNPANGPAKGAPLLDLIPALERSGDTAVSPKGATGRYQILPSTAMQFDADPKRLTDPVYSRSVAGRILADLEQRFGDDDAVLVGYNAGPAVAEKFLKAGKDVSVLPAETQSYLRRAHALGAGADYADQQREYEAFRHTWAQRQAALASDPAGYIYSLRPDLADQATSGNPAARGQAVRASLALQGDLGVPDGLRQILTKGQVEALSGELMRGSDADAVKLLQQTTAGLSPDQLQIVTRQVAPKDQALAGAIAAAGTSPQLARNIIIGHRYLAANPDVKPQPRDVTATVDGLTGGSEGWFSSRGGLFEFAPDARGIAVATATALYGKALIGQKASEFDQDKFQDAFNSVVGKPVTFRGQITVAPIEGMTASDLEDAMRSVDEAALKRFGNGQPVDASGRNVTAADIARHGVLAYTGAPGVYRVRFPGQGVIGVKGPGQTFLLNLGAMVGAH